MNNENTVVESNEKDVNSETPMIFAEKTKAIIDKTENKFLRGFYIFIFYIANIFVDFARSCKRNPSKIAGLLIATPGVFIGFLLGIQIVAIKTLTDIKLAPLALFALTLLGALNIFEAVGVMGKRSLGASIMASIVTAVILAFGAIYLEDVFGSISNTLEIVDGFVVDSNIIISLITVIGSMILSTAGCIMSYFFIDKNYQKDRS